MKLTTLALSVVLFAACVPASEKQPPAGAAGFTTEPSSVARGEPLTTSDGWTVTFTKVAVQANVNAYAVEGSDLERGFSGSNDIWLWNGSRPALVYVRELGAGPWEIDVRMMIHYGPRADEDGDVEPVINLGVSREDEARFRALTDAAVGGDLGYSGPQGPNMLIALRAEKGGRTVELDLTWAAQMVSTSSYATRVRREVHADSVDVGPLRVEPERLLLEADHAYRFEPIAVADTDHDGRVTAAELAAAPQPPLPSNPPGWDDGSTLSLEDALAFRCGDILVLQ